MELIAYMYIQIHNIQDNKYSMACTPTPRIAQKRETLISIVVLCVYGMT